MLFLNLSKHLSLISILYLVNKYKKSHSSPGKCVRIVKPTATELSPPPGMMTDKTMKSHAYKT
jgi:hypothetical protein